MSSLSLSDSLLSLISSCFPQRTDERKRLATKRTTQQLEKNIFESDLPEVEL